MKKFLLKLAIVALPLLTGGCGTTKKATTQPTKIIPVQTEDVSLLEQINKANREEFVVSKVKFTVEMGVQEITLTGNLRIKRDDVIQLQLMAFGMVEAARIELTRDYLLIMDRINKQYVKATYREIDFLRNQGINYYTLQALFGGELFMPDKNSLTSDDLKQLHTEQSEEDCVVTYEQGQMLYSWLVEQANQQIKMANINYRSPVTGNTQLNWDYQEYGTLNKKDFPSRHKIVFSSGDQKVTVGMNFSYLKSSAGWKTRTEISDKYRRVEVDQMLRRFMALG
jgi:hypothetical protein